MNQVKKEMGESAEENFFQTKEAILLRGLAYFIFKVAYNQNLFKRAFEKSDFNLSLILIKTEHNKVLACA